MKLNFKVPVAWLITLALFSLFSKAAVAASCVATTLDQYL